MTRRLCRHGLQHAELDRVPVYPGDHGRNHWRRQVAEMTDATRATIWSVLSDAFWTILRAVQATVPDVTLALGHSHNAAFLFRAYAEYSLGVHVVVLSFDVQVKDCQVYAFGDIALEDGLIVEDFGEAVIDPAPSDDALLVAHVKAFALQFQENANPIANELAAKTPCESKS
jgi:hypothetical protein